MSNHIHDDDDERRSMYSDEMSDDEAHNHHDNNSGSPKKGVAMMSLLSFYGVQDGLSAEDMIKNPEAFIDLPQFDSTAYVKKLLVEAPMEELLSKDSQMVQEIRTLDSDMQMLVYENYNKFISATETIKRMKINVEVMDDDMEHVKRKMEALCGVSVAIDDSLHTQRVKVDKIMRIKRLLNRLEFLTELPERLQEMIKQEMYEQAVVLYNKTINVLTKHAGVLSLKNIKERTELMMIDLRLKVTNLLDDPTLETIKLTQYVTILRMMQAPKSMVAQKLLAAHVSRARSMIKSFHTAADHDTSSSSSGDNVSTGIILSRTRKFHQLLIAGLIEACKGIHELFCNPAHLSSSTPSSLSSSSLSPSSSYDDDKVRKDLKDHEHAHKQLVAAIEDVIVSNYSSMMIHQVASFFHEYRMKSNEVRMLEMKIKASSSSSHDTSSNDHHHDADHHIINDASREPSDKEVMDRNYRMLQLRLYDLEDECQNWLLLARQAILDIIYLETSIIDCSPAQNGFRLRRLSIDASSSSLSSSSSSASASSSFAKSFAYDLLNIISHHVDYLFWRRILTFSEAFKSSSSAIISLSDLNIINDTSSSSSSSSSSSMTSSSHMMMSDASSSHGDPLSVRYDIQRRIGEAKMIYDTTFDTIITIFADLLADMKPVIEVYHTILPSSRIIKPSSSSSSSLSTPDVVYGFYHTSPSSSSYKVQRNILGVDISSMHHINDHHPGHDYVANIIWSYCSAIAQLVEIQGGVSYDKRIFSPALGCFIQDNDDGIIESESSSSSSSSSGVTGNNSANLRDKAIQVANDDIEAMITYVLSSSSPSLSSSDAHTCIIDHKMLYAMTCSNLLKRVSPTILRRLDAELKAQEYPTIAKESIFKAKCGARLELAAQELLSHVVERTCMMSRDLTIQATVELNKSSRLSSPSAVTLDELQLSNQSGHISSHIITLCQMMHDLCLNCCIILGEAPPQLKSQTSSYASSSSSSSSSSYASSGAGNRRVGRSSIMPGHHNATGVHLDIERLFSQKIKIYDYGSGVDMTSSSGSSSSERPQLLPTIDMIIGTFAKVSIKAMHEHVRYLTIPHMLYLRLQVQIGVIKQMSIFVLREANDVESLVDQLNSTMFSRYLDANNISSFISGNNNDNNEMALVARAVSQSIQEVSKVAILVPKH